MVVEGGTAPPPDDVFVEDGERALVRCALLFVDVLGVREMAKGNRAGHYLKLLGTALTTGTVRALLREPSADDPLRETTKWRVSLFSDTIVIAAPLPPQADEASVTSMLIEQAADLHLSLLEPGEGFFIRGGLTIGEMHHHEGVIFGAALVDGYEMETRAAIHPRVIVSDDILMLQRSAGGLTARRDLLVVDGDGKVFVNYLAGALEVPDPLPNVQRHRDLLIGRLGAHASDKPRWEKYRWTAEYHNYFVRSTLKDETLTVPVDDMTWGFEPFA